MELFRTLDNLFTEEECKELSEFYFNKKKNKQVIRDDQSGPLSSFLQMSGKVTEPVLQRAADKVKEVLSERLKKDLRLDQNIKFIMTNFLKVVSLIIIHTQPF